MSTSAFIDQLYTQFLFRQADDAGKSWWEGELNGGRTNISTLTQSFIDSAEFQSSVADVVKLYYLVLGRTPDQSGLSYWVNALQGNMALSDIAAAFVNAAWFNDRVDNDQNATGFIEQLYQNAFNRTPDDAGLNYWLEQVNQGMSWSDLVVIFAGSAEFENYRGSAVQTSSIYYGVLQRQPTDAELAAAPTSTSDLINQLYASADYSGVLPGDVTKVIAGDSGNNRLVGSSLNEEILAGSGDDILIGNGGADQLSGGAGNDRFQFTSGQSSVTQMATITDFVSGNWKENIEISGLAGYNFVQLSDPYGSLDAGLVAARAVSANQLVVFTVTADTTDSYIYLAASGDVEETLIQLQNHDGRYLNLNHGSIRTLLEGTDTADVITHNGSLDSYIDAGAGDDQIYGGSKYDYIVAGAGNDRIDGRAGNDLLDTSAARAIVNGSGQTITVNGETVATGVSVGMNAQATAMIGQDQFSNIESVVGSDEADYIALGDTLRSADGGAGNDIFLDKPNSWSTAHGGSGQDSFVFQSATNISTSADLLSDFDASEDKLIFVTNGNYQVADQIYLFDDSLSHSGVLEQIRSNDALSDHLVIFRHFDSQWLFINGNGGVSGASLNNTQIQLADNVSNDIVQLSGAISFTTEIPTVI